MEDWKKFLIEVFEELGEDANLTKDIYPLVEKKLGENLPKTWKSIVRNYLERNSSDSDAWNKNNDIFQLKNKGSGIWSLKEPSQAKIERKPLLNFEKIVQEEKNFNELKSLSIRKSNSIPKYKNINEQMPSGKKFERAVWRLFYKMGAKVFNNEKELKFDLSSLNANQSSKQIDNFFIMRDGYVFIIECKESIKVGGVNAVNLLTANLSDWQHLKKPITDRFRKIFTKKAGFKIMHVIATNGFNWSEQDRLKLEKAGFLLLRNEEIEYFSGCYENSKSAWFTFNQFLATFRKGKADFNLINKQKEVVAFRTRKDFNEVDDGDETNLSYVYTASMKVRDLIRISSVSHHSALKIYDLGNQIKSSYQRILKASRLNRKRGIPAFIEQTNKPFINNLLINYKGDEPLSVQFDGKDKLGEGRGGVLKFNSMSPGMFHLIDGQHRLFGYSPLLEDDEDSEYGDHELIITIFDNLPAEEESRLFLHINNKQEGINRGLIIEIEQLSGVHAPPKKQLQNISKSLVDHLINDPLSPFHKPKAIKGYQKSTDVYGNPIIEGSLTPQEGFIKHMVSSALLSVHNHDFNTGIAFKKGVDETDRYVNTINNLKKIYLDYFSQIKDANPNLWIKKTNDGKKISNDKKMASNIPIRGLQMLLDLFVELEVKNQQYKDISSAIQPHVDKLVKGLKNITVKDENDLFDAGFYGGGAPKEFYFTILEKFFKKLISPSLQEEIDKDKKRHNQKAIVYIQDKTLVKENETLKKELEEEDYGIQALAFRKLFANNLDPFFRKLFGNNYWEDIFIYETDKEVSRATNKAIEEYKKRAGNRKLKNNPKAVADVKKRPKILWIEWVHWKSLISFIFNKSEMLENNLTEQFRNSDKFKIEYEGKISEVVRDIFFIAKNIKNNDTNITLEWMSVIPEIRILASHGDDYLKITDDEEKEYLEIRDEIYKVVRKLADFSID